MAEEKEFPSGSDDCASKKLSFRQADCCSQPDNDYCNTLKQEAYQVCDSEKGTTCYSGSDDSGSMSDDTSSGTDGSDDSSDGTSDDSSGCDQCIHVNIMEPPEARSFACPTEQYNGEDCVWDVSTSTCGCPAGDSGDSGGCDQNPNACDYFNGLQEYIRSPACQDQSSQGGGPLGCVWDDSTSTCGCPAGNSGGNSGNNGDSGGNNGPPKALGETCNNNEECESSNCKNNACAKWTFSSNNFCSTNGGYAVDEYNNPGDNPQCNNLQDGGRSGICGWVQGNDDTYSCIPSLCEYYNTTENNDCQNDERCALINGQCIVIECSNNGDCEDNSGCIDHQCKTCTEAHDISKCGHDMLLGICTLTEDGYCVANSGTECAWNKRADCGGIGEDGPKPPECHPATLACVPCSGIAQEIHCGKKYYSSGCEWDTGDGACKEAQRTCGDVTGEDAEDLCPYSSDNGGIWGCDWVSDTGKCGYSNPEEYCSDHDNNEHICNLQGNCKHFSGGCREACFYDGGCNDGTCNLEDGVCVE